VTVTREPSAATKSADKEATEWVEKFRNVTNTDPELQAHGRYYNCSFMLDTEKHQYVVRVHEGQIEDVAIDPGPLDERYQFALRASSDTWKKFSATTPEPMYHGIFAASFQRDMRMEGDLLPLMQNLRCFVRHLELLRKTGAPA